MKPVGFSDKAWIPSCYNNTTLGNHLYAWLKGVRTKYVEGSSYLLGFTLVLCTTGFKVVLADAVVVAGMVVQC